MANVVLVAVKLALYASGFVCGTVTAASLVIMQGNLGGACILYGSVGFDNATGTIEVRASSAASLCAFVSAVSVIAAVTCFILGLCSCCCLWGGVQSQPAVLTVAVSAVFLFFLLVTGCILKIGRDSLCSSIMEAVGKITSCEQAQRAKWAGEIDGHQFYTRLHDAETAVWVNLFLWIIIGVLGLCQAGVDRAGGGAEGGSGGGAEGGSGGGAEGGFGGGSGGVAGETAPLLKAVLLYQH